MIQENVYARARQLSLSRERRVGKGKKKGVKREERVAQDEEAARRPTVGLSAEEWREKERETFCASEGAVDTYNAERVCEGLPEDFRYVSIYYINTLSRAQNGAANGARGMSGCDTGCETGKRSLPPLAPRFSRTVQRTFDPFRHCGSVRFCIG